MGLSWIRNPDEQTLERILLYGDPKTGKTRLATSLPEKFGDIVYVAVDPGAKFIMSVLPKHRPRMRVISPEPEQGKKFDFRAMLFAAAIKDWRQQEGFENVGTIVIDSLGVASKRILAQVADSGEFGSERAGDKHVGIGTPGTPEYHQIPVRGDYLAAHNIIDRFITFLFQQPLHVIVISHADISQPEGGGPIEGGPVTVGKATARSLPGLFDTVLRVTKEESVQNKQPAKVVVHCERHGCWVAGIRSHHLRNPLGAIGIPEDPEPFWKHYLEKVRALPDEGATTDER